MINQRKLIKKLEELIKYHQNLYYNKQPEISDSEFDTLWDELKRLDPDNKVFSRIGKDEIEIFQKRNHIIYMNSQAKVSTKEEFTKWFKKTACLKFLVQYKLDGVSIEIQYVNGHQTYSVTRGDGDVGDDITENVKRMRDYIHEIDENFTGSLRAEIVMLHSIFGKKYSKQYANCRNLASGISKRKDGKGSEDLSLIYYDALSVNNKLVFIDELNKLEWMKKQGFNMVNYKIFNEAEGIIAYRDNIIRIRDKLDVDIDGLVIKCNEIDLEDMRRTIPTKQIAFKFPLQTAVSRLKDVEWSVSGSTLTPIAIIDEVDIAGTKVRRASLVNPDEIQRLGIKIGSVILVSKRGDIIPKIEQVIENPSNVKDISFPIRCDTCGIKLKNIGSKLFCPNERCRNRDFHRLEKWIKTLDIKNFGNILLKLLFDSKKIRKITDLYDLTIGDIASFEGQGKRSAEVALNSLFNMKEITLEKFITAFDIEDIGELTIKILIDAGFNTLELIKNANINDLISIEGIGEITGKKIIDGVNSLYDDMLMVLKKCIISIKSKTKNILNGKSFCITGKLKTMKREEAKIIIEDSGGIYKNSIVKNLDYLVTNTPNSGSAKNKKAQELGIKLISEDQFLNMIRK